MKTVFRFALSPAVLLTVTLYTAPAILNAQTSSDCQCEDVGALISLLGQYDAARNSLDFFARLGGGSNIMYNQIVSGPDSKRTTAGENIAELINWAMGEANPDLKAKSETPCLKAVKDLHTSYRQSGLNDYKSQKKLKENEDATNFMTIQEFARLETEAFRRAAQETLNRLSALRRRSCHIGEWFGIIMVGDTKTLSSTNSIPGTNELDQGTQETFDDTTNRTGIIWFNGKAEYPWSTWRVNGIVIKTSVHNGKVDCDSSSARIDLKAKKTETNNHISTSGGGSLSISIDPEVSDDGRKFKIVFKIPMVDMSGFETQTDTITGGCPGASPRDPTSSPQRAAASFKLSGVDIESQGSIFPGDPQKVSGTDYVTIIPKGRSPGVEHTASVTYSLYKFR